jgi:hypothetical protein
MIEPKDDFYFLLLDDYREMIPIPKILQKYKTEWDNSTFSWTDLAAQQIVHDKVKSGINIRIEIFCDLPYFYEV